MVESGRHWWKRHAGVPEDPGPIKRRALRWIERYEAKQDPEELLQAKLGLLDKQIKIHGVDGGPTANGRGDVAIQLESMGRMDEARVFWEEIVASFRRNRGDDDLMTAQREEWLAANLAKSGLSEEALILLNHVEDVYRQALGNDDKETRRARGLIESIELAEGD